VIVFDLRCRSAGHVFEGWFSSSGDFEQQQKNGLMTCPICGDTAVEKAVMAPAVAPKGNRAVPARAPAGAGDQRATRDIPMSAGVDPEKAVRLMQALASAQADALKGSEWVGGRFADLARAMHYGETDTRPIHGQVDGEAARSLIEEGIEVAPLLFPVVPPEAQN